MLKRKTLDIIHKANAPHIGSALSVIDIVSAIYRSIDIEKIRTLQPDRDRVILSKFHAIAAICATLFKYNLMTEDELNTFYQNDSSLFNHKYIEFQNGSLGHGLSVGIGAAIGSKNKNYLSKVYIIIGDGELQEGTNWESLLYLGHLQLKNVCVIIDRNGYGGSYEIDKHCSLSSLYQKLCSFGLLTFEIDGHNENTIYETIKFAWTQEKPIAIICNTTKGKGISFMENENVWHYRPINNDDYMKALCELNCLS
jgi:transketolase